MTTHTNASVSALTVTDETVPVASVVCTSLQSVAFLDFLPPSAWGARESAFTITESVLESALMTAPFVGLSCAVTVIALVVPMSSVPGFQYAVRVLRAAPQAKTLHRHD